MTRCFQIFPAAPAARVEHAPSPSRVPSSEAVPYRGPSVGGTRKVHTDAVADHEGLSQQQAHRTERHCQHRSTVKDLPRIAEGARRRPQQMEKAASIHFLSPDFLC
jgi:hypothetical protein